MYTITFENTQNHLIFSFKTWRKMQASGAVDIKIRSSMLKPSKSTLIAINEAEKYKQSGKMKFTSDINELMKDLE